MEDNEMGFKVALLQIMRNFSTEGQETALKLLKNKRGNIPISFEEASRTILPEAQRLKLQDEILDKNASLSSILANFTMADTVKFSKMSQAEQKMIEVRSIMSDCPWLNEHIKQGHLENIDLEMLRTLKNAKYNPYTGEKITDNKKAIQKYIENELIAIDRRLEKAKHFNILKGADWQTQNDCMKYPHKELQLFLTGNKPAVSIDGFKIRNLKSLKDKNVDVLEKANILVNRIQVKEIIEKHKEIFCNRLQCSTSDSTEKIYQKLLKTLEAPREAGSIDDIYGLILGYPTLNSCIHHLKIYAEKKYGLDYPFIWEAPEQTIQELKKILLKALDENDSPYAKANINLKKNIVDAINSMNKASHSGAVLKNNDYINFVAYIQEPQEFERIQKNIDNFTSRMW